MLSKSHRHLSTRFHLLTIKIKHHTSLKTAPSCPPASLLCQASKISQPESPCLPPPPAHSLINHNSGCSSLQSQPLAGQWTLPARGQRPAHATPMCVCPCPRPHSGCVVKQTAPTIRSRGHTPTPSTDLDTGTRGKLVPTRGTPGQHTVSPPHLRVPDPPFNQHTKSGREERLHPHQSRAAFSYRYSLSDTEQQVSDVALASCLAP